MVSGFVMKQFVSVCVLASVYVSCDFSLALFFCLFCPVLICFILFKMPVCMRKDKNECEFYWGAGGEDLKRLEKKNIITCGIKL